MECLLYFVNLNHTTELRVIDFSRNESYSTGNNWRRPIIYILYRHGWYAIHEICVRKAHIAIIFLRNVCPYLRTMTACELVVFAAHFLEFIVHLALLRSWATKKKVEQTSVRRTWKPAHILLSNKTFAYIADRPCVCVEARNSFHVLQFYSSTGFIL